MSEMTNTMGDGAETSTFAEIPQKMSGVYPNFLDLTADGLGDEGGG